MWNCLSKKEKEKEKKTSPSSLILPSCYICKYSFSEDFSHMLSAVIHSYIIDWESSNSPLLNYFPFGMCFQGVPTSCFVALCSFLLGVALEYGSCSPKGEEHSLYHQYRTINPVYMPMILCLTLAMPDMGINKNWSLNDIITLSQISAPKLKGHLQMVFPSRESLFAHNVILESWRKLPENAFFMS